MDPGYQFHVAACNFYDGVATGCYGFHKAFVNALLMKNLRDANRKQLALDAISAVSAAQTVDAKEKAINAFLNANKDDPLSQKAKDALKITKETSNTLDDNCQFAAQ